MKLPCCGPASSSCRTTGEAVDCRAARGAHAFEPAVTMAEGWSFEPEAARRALLDQLKTHGLEGFGLEGERRQFRRPGRWSRICATRKKPTSRTSVPSVIERAATASSSIPSLSSIWRW